MEHIHAPERQPDETQKQYRERRAASRAVAVLLRYPPLPTAFRQHKNSRANLRRAAKAAIGARQYRKQRKALSLAARVAA